MTERLFLRLLLTIEVMFIASLVALSTFVISVTYLTH